MGPSDLQGWWLNLPQATERAEALTANLQALQLTSLYSRFEAGPGEADAARERGLSVGEAGAWRSWLRLLHQAAGSSAASVHLLEDDTQITTGFPTLLAWDGLRTLLDQGAIVCTDGYVSPAQARQLLAQSSWGQSWHCIHEGLAVPCIGSMLAAPGTWAAVHDQLQTLWESGDQLPAVDIALGQLTPSTVVTVAPFVTLPRLEQARKSQIRQPGDARHERSREALTLLRWLLRWPAAEAHPWDGEWDLFWRHQPQALQQQAVLDALEGLLQCGELRPY